jgi:hypothetical protein
MNSLLWALLDLASGLPSCGFSRIGAGAVRPVALDDFQNHVKLSQSFLPLPPAVQPGELSLRASSDPTLYRMLPPSLLVISSGMGAD